VRRGAIGPHSQSRAVEPYVHIGLPLENGFGLGAHASSVLINSIGVPQGYANMTGNREYEPRGAGRSRSAFRLPKTLFAKVISEVPLRPADRYPRRRVFGEMVGLLWHVGNLSAALHLERLWNNLAIIQPFALYCAYSTKGLSGEENRTALLKICAQHSRVIPAESAASARLPDVSYPGIR
jgi:hypothetical protein